MASTYVNNLRLEEIGSGEQSGTWGDTTNTNLELIGQSTAWGTRAIANASTDNITIADGAADADRCLGLKLTGGGQACTVTLLPNTSSKTWFMYNATSAALTFTCGSGANVIIPAGQTKVIATDGLGSGGVVHDLLTAVNLAGTTVVDDLTVTGDIDVDGTTNLDVVDIDGAVNMATTALVTGVLTTTAATVFNGGFAANDGSTITTADNSVQLTLKSTDADASGGPILDLTRDSANPADGDVLGLIRFKGDDAGGNETTYAQIIGFIQDEAGGAEDGTLKIETLIAGGSQARLDFTLSETVFNEGSLDLDFRVESNDNTHMIFVDAGANEVGIGTNDPRSPLHVQTAHSSTDVTAADTNSTFTIGNTTAGNGIYNSIKFAGNQQNMYMMSINHATQASRRLGFFVGSGAGDAVADERLSLMGDGAVIIKPDTITTGLQLQGRSSDNNFYVQWKSNDGSSTYGSIGTATASGNSLQYNTDIHDFNSENSATNFLELTSSGAVFNEGSADMDFRVESNGNANMLFVDGGNDHVNIGTGTDHGGVLNVETSGNNVNLVLACTDTGGNEGPILDLTRDAGNVPGDGDVMGVIRFRNDNSDLAMHNYAQIEARTVDVSAGTEDGRLEFATVVAGTEGTSRILLDGAETVVNDNSADLDFRVESNGSQKMLFVDGGNNGVLIDSANSDIRPYTTLDVVSQSNTEMMIHNDTDGAGEYAALLFKSDSQNESAAGARTRTKAGIFFQRDDPGTRGTGKLLLAVDGGNDDTNVAVGDAKITIDASGQSGAGNVVVAGAVAAGGTAGQPAKFYHQTSISLADDATLGIVNATGGAMTVNIYAPASGQGATFFVTYTSTVQVINEQGSWAVADTDGNACLFSSADAHAVTFKNRLGSTLSWNISIFAGNAA